MVAEMVARRRRIAQVLRDHWDTTKLGGCRTLDAIAVPTRKTQPCSLRKCTRHFGTPFVT